MFFGLPPKKSWPGWIAPSNPGLLALARTSVRALIVVFVIGLHVAAGVATDGAAAATAASANAATGPWPTATTTWRRVIVGGRKFHQHERWFSLIWTVALVVEVMKVCTTGVTMCEEGSTATAMNNQWFGFCCRALVMIPAAAAGVAPPGGR